MHLPLKHTSGKATLHPAHSAGWGGLGGINKVLGNSDIVFASIDKAFNVNGMVFYTNTKALSNTTLLNTDGPTLTLPDGQTIKYTLQELINQLGYTPAHTVTNIKNTGLLPIQVKVTYARPSKKK